MKAKEIFDISMELNTETPEWPGDHPFEYSLSVTKEQSGSVNIGQFKTSTHMGTHIDAPFHYDDNGLTIEEMPVEIYLSTAQDIDVQGLKEISSNDLPCSSDADALKHMCMNAAAVKPASGATTRTTLLLERTATARPIPVIAVNSGWAKKVITPRSMNRSWSASRGATSPKVRAAYR